MKGTSMANINERYPENEWLRVIIGSLVNNRKDVGAGVNCKYFSQYLVLDKNSNRYDGELEAIKAALRIIVFLPYIIQEIVMLTDSSQQ